MSTSITRWMGAALGVTLVVQALASDVFAQPPAAAVPEISPASIAAGIALLTGGVLVLRSRRRSK